jgi:hypothetical protein
MSELDASFTDKDQSTIDCKFSLTIEQIEASTDLRDRTGFAVKLSDLAGCSVFNKDVRVAQDGSIIVQPFSSMISSDPTAFMYRGELRKPGSKGTVPVYVHKDLLGERK